MLWLQADYAEGTFVKTYDTASALLGESAKPFFSLEGAYLQVGIGDQKCVCGADRHKGEGEGERRS